MNANELANALLNTDYTPLKAECASMLRTQHKNENWLCSIVKEYQNKVDELRAEIDGLREANKGFARHLIANPEDNKPVGNMCLGCGSSWSDERLEIERRLRPNLISCCPDRKVVAVYAHPEKELNDGGEPVKNATYWKRQCNLLQSSLTNLQSSLYHANEQIKYLESHQMDSRKTNPA